MVVAEVVMVIVLIWVMVVVAVVVVVVVLVVVVVGIWNVDVAEDAENQLDREGDKLRGVGMYW